MRIQTKPTDNRRGSTLLIVLSLLSILMFLGMVFVTVSTQEKAAAEFFSEDAKATVSSPDDPFPHGLRHLLVGPGTSERRSILHGPRNRHSMIPNMVGSDVAAFTGEGVRIIPHPGPDPLEKDLPFVDQDEDGTPDDIGAAIDNPLNLVDSPAAWGPNEGALRNARVAFPEPDVSYTYPDHNNMFLAFRGWAIRDNGPSVTDPTLRFERVPVVIPSFIRPALLKSSDTNGPSGEDTLTDADWYDETAHPEYSLRSMRPNAFHASGFLSDGTPVRRYLDQTNTADNALIAGMPGGSGAFPLRPSEGGNTPNFGRMGIWTGHIPFDTATPPASTDPIPAHVNFELDSDNDGDGIKEGIWMDLDYPVEFTSTDIPYVTLFSFTIYDLDSLIDLNVAGNMAGVDRAEIITNLVGNSLVTVPVSQSNLGLSPTEINPLQALFSPGPSTDSGGNPTTDFSNSEFAEWYGANPVSHLEQANMQLLWLLTGRIDFSDSDTLYPGKWGDENALWYHAHGGDGGGTPNGPRNIASLPRPGRAGNLATASTDPVNFGGFFGLDDNGDIAEGIVTPETGLVRGYRHPLDYGGTGRFHSVANPLLPNWLRPDANKPMQYLQYDGYSLTGNATTVFNDISYAGGVDQDFTTVADNLVVNPSFNAALDDATEVIFDQELTVRPDDAIFGPEDLMPAQLSSADISASLTTLSTRLGNLAPVAFGDASEIKERFTTLSNSLRYFPLPHDLGPNLQNDGGTGDDGSRWWEWTADTDGDGRSEFPPAFGTGTSAPYAANDPFRAVVRRLMTTEVGERFITQGQLPLSVNHVLDVNRTSETPAEGTPEFTAWLRRSGMRYRLLTEHPNADDPNYIQNSTDQSEVEQSGIVADLTSIPTLDDATAGADALRDFPPRVTAHQEFWARRDRQKLARDIYVLLYTMGGARNTGGTIGNPIVNYTGDNSGNALYTQGQVRRMAQLAVNIVDAMDTDDVATKFEYDKNLGDGWELDDDPYSTTDRGAAATLPTTAESVETSVTGNGVHAEDNAEFGVVYGVEGQQLAFSEALATYSRMLDSGFDLTETPYSDESGHRVFLHVEIQNLLPSPVSLSRTEVGTTNEDFALWRMMRIDRVNAADSPNNNTPNQTFSLMNGNNDVDPNDNFTIAIANLEGSPADRSVNGFSTADIFIDDDTNGQFHLIAPDTLDQTTTFPSGDTPLPQCDIDTQNSRDDTKYQANGTPDGGQFLEGVVDDPGLGGNPINYNGNDFYGEGQNAAGVFDGGTTGFELVLQRRLNPNMPQLPLSDNPFIEVDRIVVPLQELITGTGAAAAIDLEQLQSTQRVEALNQHAVISDATTIDATNKRRNSLGAEQNDNSAAGNSVWQAHFDRPFTSIGDLMQVPVVGPNLLTNRMDRMRYPALQQTADNPAAPTLNSQTEFRCSNAESLILMPEMPETSPTQDNDNRWYRVLQLLEVPSRLNRQLGNYLNLTRLPGRVNINGLRHLEVYAGILDHPIMSDLPLDRDPSATPTVFDQDNRYAPFLRDTSPGVGTTQVTGVSGNLPFRDRYFEFVDSRDGATLTYNPITTSETNFWIPGSLNAKPFHALTANRTDAADALNKSILRELPFDDTSITTNRSLLEAGTASNHDTPAVATNGMLRHQLTSKLLNTTTTTSNTFVIFATAAYFEAVIDTDGFVRVGGRMDLDGDTDITDGWEQRAAFVIDRTEAYDALDSGSGSFEWQRLIKYRADLIPTND